jgi:cytochrome oxidase assembly protein ShyY1
MNYLRDSWKRWVAWLFLAIAFAIACGFLSNWQFNRRAEALAQMHQVSSLYNSAPIAVQDKPFKATDEWRPVSITGHFLPSNVLLVRNRPLDGDPGFLELLPFQADSGVIYAVEAGWLPADDRLNPPKVFPLPAATEQSIWGHERPSEPTLDRSAPSGQIATINLPTFAKLIGAKDRVQETFYVSLGESNFANKAGLPKLLPMPQLDEGNHLSYAIQWIIFAVLAFFALVWAVRQEIHFKRLANDANYVPKQRKKVGDEDKAAEDAV